jgi:hypothetical protein
LQCYVVNPHSCNTHRVSQYFIVEPRLAVEHATCRGADEEPMMAANMIGFMESVV